MSKSLNIVAFPALFALSLQVLYAGTVELNEDLIRKAALRGSPQLDQIQAAFMMTKLQKGQVDEQFAPEVFGRGSYLETNEQPIIPFIPIFSPIKQVQLGVRKNLNHGIYTEAAITTDQRSADSQVAGEFTNATTTAVSFTMQMDLWKDLFGRLSKANLKSAQLESKRGELEKEIQTKAFHISLRRIYWSLVANQEALNISEALLKTARLQASETNLRYKNSVAESDEVSGYSAQVASREGTLTYIKYQRETLLKQLRNLLPELANEELVLSKYDLTLTFDEVMGCTATIAKEQKVPYHFTRYDEATDLMRKIRNQASVINSRYSDADVKLFGTVQSTGVSSRPTAIGYRGSYGGSIDDQLNHNRTGYEVGVLVSVPIGDVKEMNEKTKEYYDELRMNAAIVSSDLQVINTHQQLVKSVTLLNEVIRSQKINSTQLGKRLKFMRRKYEQARAGVNDLIQDQDALLNSELTTIDTKLQIINVLFDYLAIYTETPCAFNRI